MNYGYNIKVEGCVCADDDNEVGRTERTFRRDRHGYLVIDNDSLVLQPAARGRGFAHALYAELEVYYRRSRVDVITVHAALENGGYAWAQAGFDWDPEWLDRSFANIRDRIDRLLADPETSSSDSALLREVRRQMDVNDAGEGWPTPQELAQLHGDDRYLGRKLMMGSNWYRILPLTDRGDAYGT